MLNTNSWNRIRYTVYKPFYDVIANYFRPFRSQSIKSLGLNKDDHILIIGAGTGLDLEFFKGHKNITAIDITPSMLNKFETRAKAFDIHANTQVMDASQLEFKNNQFDAVILHLILAVIPKPVKCIQEVERVLKSGAKFTVMDKFLTPGKPPSLLRRIINPFSTFLATTVTRDIDFILSKTSLRKTKHEKLGSIFWLIQGSKPIID
jgi:ubiquinone/menaquinone biosynthesis C-methylase UbiE